MRRGMPIRPRMCIGKYSTFMPMNIVQKCHLPIRSSSMRPLNLGNQ